MEWTTPSVNPAVNHRRWVTMTRPVQVGSSIVTDAPPWRWKLVTGEAVRMWGRECIGNLCTFHSILQWTKNCSEKSSLLWKHLVRWEVITTVTATIYGCWALDVYQQHCSSHRLLLACSISSYGFIKMRIVLLSLSAVQAVGLSQRIWFLVRYHYLLPEKSVGVSDCKWKYSWLLYPNSWDCTGIIYALKHLIIPIWKNLYNKYLYLHI